MAIRYPGRASIDPSAPQAVGVCDRCGQLYNLRDLKYQPVWAGPNILVTTLRVCTVTCWDVPNEQLRTIRIPPDPWPVSDPRVENFAVDEKNFLDLRAWVGKPSMFLASSSMTCELDVVRNIAAAIDGVSSLNADLLLNTAVLLEGEISGTSEMDATLSIELGLVAEISGTSVLNVELEQVSPTPVTRSLTDTYSFQADNTYTEVGASFGAADASRQIYVAISGLNDTSLDGIDSVTIGGVAATLAVEELRDSGGGAFFSSIYYAAVPTGTSGDIVTTFTGDTIFAAVAVYRVINADAVAPIGSTASANVDMGSVSANITPGNLSVTIGTAFVGADTSDEDITWTNLTEDADLAVSVGVFVLLGFASRGDATSPGSIAISANATNDIITDKTLAICNIVP